MDGPTPDNWVFNATQLAEELHERVLQPARDDQAYVDGFGYLTRLYARLRPEEMTKQDPFFTFNSDLPPFSNIHVATALPVCSNDIPTALDITLENGGQQTFTVPAQKGGCGAWVPADNVVLARQ